MIRSKKRSDSLMIRSFALKKGMIRSFALKKGVIRS